MKKGIKKFTREWFAEQGRIGGAKGGNRTKELYGLKFFSDIRKGTGDKSKAKVIKAKNNQ